MSECIAFGKKVEWGRYEDAALYKNQNRLVLIVDLKDADMREVDRFFAAAFEFAQSVEENSWKAAFLREHAKTIIPEHALQVLVNL